MIKELQGKQGQDGTGVSARVIVCGLRRQIITGDWAPGTQLPIRSEIEAQFGASRVTVQRALDELRREGWVQVDGRKGTYVAPFLPHLTRFAMVFPNDTTQPSNASKIQFWNALSAEAKAWQGENGRTVGCYFGVDGHEDSEGYQQLVREVHNHKVAGIIFAASPHQLLTTPLINQPNLPRVAIMSLDKTPVVPAVTPDGETFWKKALDHVVKDGRRRVAFITPPKTKQTPEYFFALARERGLITRPYWHQMVGQMAPEAATNAVHSLLHMGQKERPDAVIISDDNLVYHAGLGILASGMSAPQDVEVVAHCNYPYPAPSAVPVTLLGFDVRSVLAACINSLEQQRQGLPLTQHTSIPALFEHELEIKEASAVSQEVLS